ncbi:T9SS type A sorting domain-containing protein [Dyadobacter sp. 32]|uniref:T9SS type A sorting domain-containing protein n=1 Tax=Dyadobacter sp. 32 TaxID=538966 RepID=UPI0011ECBA96
MLLYWIDPGAQSNSFQQIKGNDSSGQIQLSIADVKGRLLYQNTEYVLGNTKRIPLSDLPALRPGVFIAKIVSGNQHSAVTFVISDP